MAFQVTSEGWSNDHISDDELLRDLTRYFYPATDTGEPIVVTRQTRRGNVLMILEADFASWQEPVHLLSSPYNAARLLRSVRRAKAGEATVHDLIEPKPATDA